MSYIPEMGPPTVYPHPLSEQDPLWSISGSIFVKVEFYYKMWNDFFLPRYLFTDIEIRVLGSVSPKGAGNKNFDADMCEGCPGVSHRLYIVLDEEFKKLYLTAGSMDWSENWPQHERDRCYRVFSRADMMCVFGKDRAIRAIRELDKTGD